MTEIKDDEHIIFKTSKVDCMLESTSTEITITDTKKFNVVDSGSTEVLALSTDGKLVSKNAMVSKTETLGNSEPFDVTYTAVNIINTILTRNCNGSNRTDVLPNATDIVAAIPDCHIGSSFTCFFRNTGTDHLLSIDDTGTDVTLHNNKDIPYNTGTRWLFIVDNVLTPAVSGYILNTPTLNFVDNYSIDIDGGYLIAQPSTPSNFPTYRAANGTGASDAWSISLWVKYNNLVIVDFSTLYAQHQFPIISSINMILIQARTSQNIRLTLGNFSDNIRMTTTNNIFTGNDWHHLLITYNGGLTGANPPDPVAVYTANLKIFIDGILQTTTDSLQGTGVVDGIDADAINLNNGITGTGNPFPGKVDQFAIWDSDQQANIAAIYNGGVIHNLAALSPPPSNYWRINPNLDSFPTIKASLGSTNITATNLVVGDYSTDIP